jgi:hypothetical protein
VPDDVLTVTVPADGVVVVRQFAGRAVSIRPVRKRRSLDQNAYWWAVPVRLIAEYCGYDPEQMHYALLGEWQGYVDGPVGPPVPRCSSSSKLTTAEFTELIDWVQRWAAEELDVQIPSPGEWQAGQS